MKALGVVVCALAFACSHPAKQQQVAAAPPPRTLTIIGTNDLHGAIERLPLLAGFVANVRAARAADGGGVLLVDAGDLFQGTLESNLGEGIDVVRAYNQMGYAASAIGNHEFDYGPEGPAVTAQSPADDPRGALKARVAQAAFPFLVTNITDAKTGQRIAWPNAPASRIVEVAGIHVGIVGASTESTPFTTMPANFVGLRMTSAALAIAAEAKAVRDHAPTLIAAVKKEGPRLGADNASLVEQVASTLARARQDEAIGKQTTDRGLFEAIAQIVGLRRATAPVAIDLLERFVMPAL